jgi:hypothetical protein
VPRARVQRPCDGAAALPPPYSGGGGDRPAPPPPSNELMGGPAAVQGELASQAGLTQSAPATSSTTLADPLVS